MIEPDGKAFSVVDTARSEWVLTLTGRVVARSPETVNEHLATGEVELRIEEASVQGRAEELPLPVFGDHDYPEETRLTYRFLDLRRERLHKNIMLRANIITSLRRRMNEQGFTEFQTPILTASSPEGARDFLVPSRRYPGQFYALPQAPQQFKQLIMVAGFDRYFQIAPCFRDEDGRADRSPGEFYQLDLEMSFVTQDDVFAAVEPVLAGVFEEFANGKTVTKPPFVRIPYAEAMLKYGTDKPDLRNPIEIAVVSHLICRADVEFKASQHKTVRAIPAPGAAPQPRSFFDKMNDWARAEGAPGLGYIQFEEEGGALTGKGPIAKFIPAEALAAMARAAGVKAGDALFFSADAKSDRAASLAGMARTRLGRELNLIPLDIYKFCWIVDFPMYEWSEEEKKIDFSHNPFSMPQYDREKFLALANDDKDTILGLKAYQYDIVCNGYELSSGAPSETTDPGCDAQGFRDRRLRPRRDRGKIQGHAQRLPPRRAAAWRHRARHRPHRDAAGGRRESARSHHVPDDPVGAGPDDERPQRRHAQAAQGAAFESGLDPENDAGFVADGRRLLR